ARRRTSCPRTAEAPCTVDPWGHLLAGWERRPRLPKRCSFPRVLSSSGTNSGEHGHELVELVSDDGVHVGRTARCAINADVAPGGDCPASVAVRLHDGTDTVRSPCAIGHILYRIEEALPCGLRSPWEVTSENVCGSLPGDPHSVARATSGRRKSE